MSIEITFASKNILTPKGDPVYMLEWRNDGSYEIQANLICYTYNLDVIEKLRMRLLAFIEIWLLKFGKHTKKLDEEETKLWARKNIQKSLPKEFFDNGPIRYLFRLNCDRLDKTDLIIHSVRKYWRSHHQ
ncbi:MAG: hypothetical protein ACXAC2_17450 [Candidatus Kariarchaeaceae archaeon]|jgi:hypothetical protein